MEKAYRIIRVNQEESSLTVMLNVGRRELQEDVVVEDFSDKAAIFAEIEKRLLKFEEDLKRSEQPQKAVDPEIQNLVDNNVKSFVEEGKN